MILLVMYLQIVIPFVVLENYLRQVDMDQKDYANILIEHSAHVETN